MVQQTSWPPPSAGHGLCPAPALPAELGELCLALAPPCRAGKRGGTFLHEA